MIEFICYALSGVSPGEGSLTVNDFLATMTENHTEYPSGNPITDTFFQRARHEAQRYGDDPWVFLREMVQNSRDAKATHISVKTHTRNGHQLIRCEDDGEGMSLDELEHFFLRLYASSKEERGGSIGFFGVGFWSVLLFDPVMIRVTTSRGTTARTFEIDCKKRSLNMVAPESIGRGTRIELMRQETPRPADDLKTIVREKLIYYAAHVRPFPGKDRLILECDGEVLNRGFPRPSHFAKFFKNKKFDGVAGFDDNPSVRIYKGGILVRDLTTLEEVIPKRESSVPYAGWGFHPVVALNIDHLQILMDRQRIFEDRELFDAVNYCEHVLLKAHGKLVRRHFPMDIRNLLLKTGHVAKKFWGRLGLTIAAMATVFFLSFGKGFIAERNFAGQVPTYSDADNPEVRHISKVDRILPNWQGPIIDGGETREIGWDFSYQGPDFILFRIGTLDGYHEINGLVHHAQVSEGGYPRFSDNGSEKIPVEMGVSASDNFINLPIPPDYVVLADSVRLDEQLIPLSINTLGDPIVQVPRSGRLIYELQKQKAPRLTTSFSKPDIAWREPYRSAILSSLNTPSSEAVRQLSRLVRNNLSYKRDPYLAEQFRQDRIPWVEKVLRAGGGDCDILNGLLVMMARSAGIDATLSIGLIGENGGAKSTLHAWMRYDDQGWRTVDVTAQESIQPLVGTGGFTNSDPFVLPQPVPREPNIPRIVINDTEYPAWTWIVVVMVPLIVLTVVFFRKDRKADGEPGHLANLIQHYLKQGLAKDPLDLRFRPVFGLAGTQKKLSLFQLEQAARDGVLPGARRNSGSWRRIRSRKPILDLDDPLVQNLSTLLPEIVDLADLDESGPRILPELWQEAETIIRQMDPRFRIHLTNSRRLEEIKLKLRRPNTGSHHLLLGRNHPGIVKLNSIFAKEKEMGIFLAVRFLLDKSTFYLNQKDSFLGQLAMERLPR
jgi:hypothetical protein